MFSEESLTKAKCDLYAMLMEKGADNWTSDEVDIAFHLSRDESVQPYIQSALGRFHLTQHN